MADLQRLVAEWQLRQQLIRTTADPHCDVSLSMSSDLESNDSRVLYLECHDLKAKRTKVERDTLTPSRGDVTSDLFENCLLPL